MSRRLYRSYSDVIVHSHMAQNGLNPIPFHLDSLWSATLISLRSCATNWQWSRTPTVGKNFGPIL